MSLISYPSSQLGGTDCPYLQVRLSALGPQQNKFFNAAKNIRLPHLLLDSFDINNENRPSVNNSCFYKYNKTSLTQNSRDRKKRPNYWMVSKSVEYCSHRSNFYLSKTQ